MITRLMAYLGSIITLNDVPIVNGGDWGMALEYSLVDIIALAVGTIAVVTLGIITIRSIVKSIARRKDKNLARAKERVLAKENEKSREKQDSKKIAKTKAKLNELTEQNNSISNNKFHGKIAVRGGDVTFSLANEEVYNLVTEYANKNGNKSEQKLVRLDVDYPEYSTHKDEFVVAPSQFLKTGVLTKYIYENIISDKADYPISYTLTDNVGNKETFSFPDANNAATYLRAKIQSYTPQTLAVIGIDPAKLEKFEKVDYAQLRPENKKNQDFEGEGK